MLDEGARTLGVWLPLALADLKAAVLMPWMSRADAEKHLKLSRTLAGWCLPMLSRSAAADEAEREAVKMFKTVQRMSEAQKQKQKQKNETT